MFLAILMILCSAGMIAVTMMIPTKEAPWTYGVVALFALLITVPFVMLASRKRPLYEIDSRGITDYGLVTRGFGLIEWHHIKYVQTFTHKGHTSLVIKVDNLDDLLARRNALLRPFLWLNCKLSALLGGELMLPITISTVGLATVLESASECSRQSSISRDVVIAPRTLLENLGAQVAIALFVLPIIAIIFIASTGVYVQWIPHAKPSLEIVGASVDFPSYIAAEKDPAWLDSVVVKNFGGAASGLKVELSGDAFDKGYLSEPRVLIEYDDERVGAASGGGGGDSSGGGGGGGASSTERSQRDASSAVIRRVREIVPLRQERARHWTGTSKTAYFPHKDDILVDTLNFFMPGGKSDLKKDIGWWTDLTHPNLTLILFANASKKEGMSGNLSVTVTPLSSPDRAVHQTMTIERAEGTTNNVPIYSVSVPTNYPVTLYPNSSIVWLSPAELRFDCAGTPTQVAQYYEEELKNKGWKVKQKEDTNMNQLELVASKGAHEITARIQRTEGHTPVWMTLY